MLAVKGYIDSGRFTPTDGAKLPAYAHAVLVIDISLPHTASASPSTKDKSARTDWLNQLRQARRMAKNDPLPDFVVRQPMRDPHGLTD
jgi:hypothetical protein